MGWGAGAASTPKSNQRMLDQSPVASNVIGTPWPSLYGTRNLAGTLIAWTNHTVSSSGGSTGKGGGAVTSGEKDFRTAALGFGIGPFDGLFQIEYDNEIIWQGSISPADAALVADDTVGIGGVVLTVKRGTITVYFGLDNQTQDPVLKQFIPDVPYYRGFVYAVLHGIRTGTRGFNLGSSDTLAQITFRFRRIPPAPPGTAWQNEPKITGPTAGLASDFAVAADLTDYEPTGNDRKDRRYQITFYGTASTTTATVDIADLDQLDAPQTGLVITNGAPFALGSMGATATATWSGALTSTPLKNYQVSVSVFSNGTIRGAANPAFILYEWLTDPAHGVPIPDALIEGEQFASLADAIGSTGLSFARTERGALRDIFENVLGDIQSVLAFTDGVFQVRMIAGTGTVLTLQPTDILGQDRRPWTWYELPTVAIITFPDETRKYKDNTIPLMGALQLDDDDKVDQITLDRVTNSDVARIVGGRRFFLDRLPQKPDQITCSRVAAKVQAGDPIVVNDASTGYGLTEQLIVLGVEELGIGDESVTLTVTRNFFGSLPDQFEDVGGSGTDTGGGGGGISNEYPEVGLQTALELPYLFATDQTKRVTLFVVRPAADASGFSLWASLDDIDYDEVFTAGVFHAGGVLSAAVAPRFTMDRAATIDFTADAGDIDAFQSLTDADWFARKMLVLIGSGKTATLYSAKEILLLGGNRWRIRGVYGPLGDTLPDDHAPGTPIWIFRINPLYNVLAEPAWTNGTTVYFRAIPFGSRPSPPFRDAVSAVLTISDRARRPYAPDTLLANNTGSDNTPVYSDDIILSCALRDRADGFGVQTVPSPFTPNGVTEIASIDFEIRVATVLVRTINATVFVGTATTTVSAGAPTRTAFDVADASALVPGYRISVTIGGVEYFARIKTIAGSSLALFGEGLPVAPAGGETLRIRTQAAATYTAAENAADNGSAAAEVDISAFSVLVGGLRSLNPAQTSVIKV